MSRSTPRTGLPRTAGILLSLTLAASWWASGSVLAYAPVGRETAPAVAPLPAAARAHAAVGSLGDPAALRALHDQLDDRAATAVVTVDAAPKAVQAPKATVKPAVVKPTVRQPTYTGQNRFWIPSLGMSDRVHWFACTRSRDPDNYIYRWGCAGSNNVYILGHAYGVMKPLHDAYVRGALHKGMVAIYADGAGVVHWYKVVSWRVVDPAEVAWAIADQPVPSMTLQTCVGKDGQLRLNVRLVQFKVT